MKTDAAGLPGAPSNHNEAASPALPMSASEWKQMKSLQREPLREVAPRSTS